MTLPANFSFNQAILQDFVDCKRRFQLRYLLQVPWPAVVVEPALERERLLRLGGTFHRMIHQHKLGIPAHLIHPLASEKELRMWWDNYRKAPPPHLPALQSSEVLLSDRFQGVRLTAKYDLIAIQPDQKAIIVDWKTSAKRPPESWLVNRMQTRLYPFLLIRAGKHLNQGEEFQPNQVEMIYWFANHPRAMAVFPYSPHQYQMDEAFLANLIARIEELSPDGFLRTETLELCRFCPYRSLCDRGDTAGSVIKFDQELEPIDGTTIDWEAEQVAEAEF